MDIAWQFDWCGNLDCVWERPFHGAWFEALASFARVILHDRRGTGLSSRDTPPPNLETRAADLLAVLDEVGSRSTVIAATFEGLAPGLLLAGTDPDRVRGLVWWDPAHPAHGPGARLPVGRGPAVDGGGAARLAALGQPRLWGGLGLTISPPTASPGLPTTRSAGSPRRAATRVPRMSPWHSTRCGGRRTCVLCCPRFACPPCCWPTRPRQRGWPRPSTSPH